MSSPILVGLAIAGLGAAITGALGVGAYLLAFGLGWLLVSAGAAPVVAYQLLVIVALADAALFFRTVPEVEAADDQRAEPLELAS